MAAIDTIPTSQPEEPALTLNQYLAFGALVLGAFLAVIDIQIVASSIGSISASLGATLEEVAWVQSAYLTAEIIVIPITAWLTLTFSTRNVVIAAILGFVAASLGCALAWDLSSMVVFRVIQGLFGGMLIPIVMTAVYVILPPGRQASGIAAVGFVLLFSQAIGPALGGWITDTLSWHWLFLLNIPAGLLIAIAAYFTINFDKPNYSLIKTIDIWGLLLIALFLGCGEFVLKEGTKYDWFESTLISQLFFVSIVSFLLLIWRELSIENPVVDLRLFRNMQFSLACTLALFIGIIQFGQIFLIPAILSSIRGFNAMQIGSVMMVLGVFSLIGALAAAALEKRIGVRTMAAMGFSLMVVGMWVDQDMTHVVGHDQLFLGQAIRGLGLMLMFLPLSTVALGHLKEHQISHGSGFFNLTRNLGGAIGLSLVTWMMQTRQDHHYHRISEAVTQGRSAYDTVTEIPAPDMQLGQILPDLSIAQMATTEMATRLAEREALIMTYNDVWIFLTFVAAASFLLVPFMKKPAAGAAAGGVH